ncbi:TonB-dependent receptor [Sandaracinobacter sp. RS1-74]|uniref:TonB-dependent receptor plug domain-containing protein n=1 Tax=Sandaracinobacteroides sayramensis TaxID=2913411 RepID=UPI001EDAB0F1|nr:TonB-dependent receptor [Sandaracinobacteroides sayramensis]MCG2841621.1 TonB-dependent receptor [Sandaracinobacteroides sayramensis]
MLKGTISLLAVAVAAPAIAAAEAPDAIVVTASRSGDGTKLANLPASVTLIGSEDLVNRQTRILSDVLRDVPGVAVSRTGAIGGLTQIRVRGTEGNHVLVMIDGIKASDPYHGEYDFGTLIADETARVEVLRGQQSSLYGSDAIGGVIQYITLTGREAPGFSARVEGGSFGTVSGGARAAGFTDSFDYAVSASAYRTDGTPTARHGTRDVGSTSVGASAKLNWTPSEILKFTAVGRYSYTDADTNNSESDPTSPWFGYTVDSPGVHFVNKAFYGLARGELTLADGRWTNALTAQIADTRRRGYDEDGFDYGNNGRRYKGAFESAYRFGNEAIEHRLTGAVDFEREEFQNLVDSPYAFTGWRSTSNWGLVGQYELDVNDAFFAGASIRHDFNNRFADVTTWRAQAGYRLPMGLRVRGAYGTGVKNPGFFELFGYSDGKYIGNPNLRPEKSKGWEAGIDQVFGDGLATIGATYFDSRLTDEIYTSYPPPNYVATPSNRTTKSKQQGVEFFLSANPLQQIRFDLAYTWLKARENGVEEVRRPKHVGSLNLTYRSLDERFSTTFTARYNGRQTDVAYTDPSWIPVRVSLKEYVLVNLNAEYRLSEAFTLFGRVENLLDENYEEVFSFATPGRAVYGGVKARF